MPLLLESYDEHLAALPQSGRRIIAQFNYTSIVVYQAYSKSIGDFATTHNYFGGEFKLERMSWIKTSFLWMMHRSGWATKPNQESILAIWLNRDAFDTIVKQALPSSFVPESYDTSETWKRALDHSSVRVQWAPDYDPFDKKLERRAIQLGLSGSVLQQYAHSGWIEHIEDITSFVEEQRNRILLCEQSQLLLPRERIYQYRNQ